MARATGSSENPRTWHCRYSSSVGRMLSKRLGSPPNASGSNASTAFTMASAGFLRLRMGLKWCSVI